MMFVLQKEEIIGPFVQLSSRITLGIKVNNSFLLSLRCLPATQNSLCQSNPVSLFDKPNLWSNILLISLRKHNSWSPRWICSELGRKGALKKHLFTQDSECCCSAGTCQAHSYAQCFKQLDHVEKALIDCSEGGMLRKCAQDTVRVLKHCSSFPSGTATQVTQMQSSEVVQSIPLGQVESDLQ